MSEFKSPGNCSRPIGTNGLPGSSCGKSIGSELRVLRSNGLRVTTTLFLSGPTTMMSRRLSNRLYASSTIGLSETFRKIKWRSVGSMTSGCKARRGASRSVVLSAVRTSRSPLTLRPAPGRSFMSVKTGSPGVCGAAVSAGAGAVAGAAGP